MPVNLNQIKKKEAIWREFNAIRQARIKTKIPLHDAFRVKLNDAIHLSRLTLAEISEITGISPSQIYRISHGHTSTADANIKAALDSFILATKKVIHG